MYAVDYDQSFMRLSTSGEPIHKGGFYLTNFMLSTCAGGAAEVVHDDISLQSLNPATLFA